MVYFLQKLLSGVNELKVTSRLFFVFISLFCCSIVGYSQAITVSNNTGTGSAVSPLVSGSTSNAILGFNLVKGGGGANTVSQIIVDVGSSASVYSSASLWQNTSGSNKNYPSGYTNIASGTIGSTTITFAGGPNLTTFGGGSGGVSESYFVVVTVANSVSTTTSTTTASLANANVTIGTSTKSGSATGSGYNFTCSATVTSANNAYAMVAGASAKTIAAFPITSNSTAQVLDKLYFVFSADVATELSGYVVNDGSTDLTSGVTYTYDGPSKSLTVTGLNSSLSTSPKNYILKANVLNTATTMSPTITLSPSSTPAGVQVTAGGGGTVNSFTDIVETLNITGASATVTGSNNVYVLVGGETGKTISDFSISSTGTAQVLDKLFFQFSADVTGQLSNFVLRDVTTATNITGATYTYDNINFTLAITGINDALTIAAKNFILKADVSSSAGTASQTITLSPSSTPAGVQVTAAGGGIVNSFTNIVNTLNETALTATVTGATNSYTMVGGDLGKTIFDFSMSSAGTTQSLSSLVFLFSTDITGQLSNFVLRDVTTATNLTGATYNYVFATQTLTITGIADALTTSAKNFILKADVNPSASTASQTISLKYSAGAGVTVTGGGTVNSFTNIVDNLTENALVTTVTGTGTSHNLSAGTTTQTLATFSASSTGSVQALSQIDFVFSTDIAAIFNTANFKLNNGGGNVGSASYTAGTKTLSFTSIADALSTTPKSYTLTGDVLAGATASSPTVSLTYGASVNPLVSGGGTVNSFTTITNTLNILYSAASTITLTGGTTTPINLANYSQQTASGLTVGNSTSLATFQINDGGGSDPDSKSTTLTDITLSVANFGNLQTIALFNGATNVSEQTVSSGSVSFNSLSLVAADNGTTSFTIRGTFNTTVTDNQLIQLTITSATASTSGSTFAALDAGGAQTNGTTNNKINVVSTKFLLTGLTPNPPLVSNVSATNLFSLTASAADANDNIDTDETGNVTLAKTTGSGTLTSATGLTSKALSSGSYTWSDLKISLSGPYLLTLTCPSGACTGLTTATINFTVKSTGVNITAASPINVCLGTGFQTLTDITLTETDPADFTAGTNLYFYLELPTGFVFNTGINTTPSFTASKDVTSTGALSYIGNTIVRFKYSVSGTANLGDSFTISGLQVQFVGTNPVAGNLLELDGSGVITGDTEADAKSHCVINGTIASNANYDFGVSALPGQGSISSTQTQFNTSIANIILSESVGSPKVLSNLVFSGTGVTFSSLQHAYLFAPASVGTGSYPVTFTGNEPVTGCLITFTKTLSVTSTGIVGLANQYCSNDNTPLSLSVPSSSYDYGQYFIPYNSSTTYNGYEYVGYGGYAWYANPVGGFSNQVPSTGDPIHWTLYYGYNLTLDPGNGQPYFVMYAPPNYKTMNSFTSNGSGTLTITSPSHGYSNGTPVLLYAYVYDASFSTYVYVPYNTYTISNVTTNTFDISYSLPAGGYPNGTYIYLYGYIQLGNPSITNATGSGGNTITITATGHGLTSNEEVNIYIPGLDDPNDASSGAINNWYRITVIDADNFTISSSSIFTGIFSGPGSGGYVDIFNYRFSSTSYPSTNTNLKPSDFQILNKNFGTISYGYIGFMTTTATCSSGCVPFVFTNAYVQLLTPPAVDFTGIGTDICQNATTVNITGSYTTGSYTVATGVTDIGGGKATFNPSLFSSSADSPASITYSYTDNNQCNNTITKNITVRKLPVTTPGANGTVCSDGVTSTSYLLGGTPVTPTAVGNGPFTYAWTPTTSLDDPTLANPSASPVSALNYHVLVTDLYGCAVTSSNVNVAISTKATSVAGSPYVSCSSSATINMNNTGSSATGALSFWSTNGTGTFPTNNGTPNQGVYAPSIADNAGGTLLFTLTTVDPDGGGPCIAVSSSVNITINRAAQVVAMPDYPACGNNPVSLTSTIGGSTSSVTWTGGSNSTGYGGSNSSTSQSTIYTPSGSEATNGANITFTVTTDDPDGVGGPCVAVSDQVIVTLNQPATVNAGNDQVICGSVAVTLAMSATIPQIGGGASNAIWSSPVGTIDFTANSGTFINSIYTPTNGDIANGSVNLTLTTNDPDGGGPCLAASDVVLITINKAATVNAGVDKTFCAGNTITLDRDYTGASDATLGFGGSASSITWTEANQPGIVSPTLLGTTYNPTNSELNNGASLDFTLTTNDPDGVGGPCPAVSDHIIITINQAATVALSGPLSGAVCADQPINISGNFSGSATSATLITNGSGNLSQSVFSGVVVPFSISSVYTLNNPVELFTQNQILEQFTLTSNDPDGAGPCLAAVTNLFVTVNPIPPSPVVQAPQIPTGQSGYCINDVIRSASAFGQSGSTIKWYSDAALSTLLSSGNNYTPAPVTSSESSTSYYVTQVSSAGCESKAPASNYTSFVVNVYPRPDLTFKVDLLCLGDLATYDASASVISTALFPASQIVSYGWDFADGSLQQAGQVVQHQHSVVGTWDAVLTSSSDQGCISTLKASGVPTLTNTVNSSVNATYLPANSAVKVGVYPIPKIDVVLQCFGDNTKFTGSDISTNANPSLNQWSWNFGDGNSGIVSPSGAPTSVITNNYAAIGNYGVALTITTNLGCVTTNNPVKLVPILPYLNTKASFPYIEDFESATIPTGGWVPSGYYQDPGTQAVASGYSWQLNDISSLYNSGQTLQINAAYNGTNAWITNTPAAYSNFFSSYYPNERSVLYGPCVNLDTVVTKLGRPVFSVDYWNETELQNDGATVEVSTDEGATWKVLGKLNGGLNWYNKAGISGLSINSAITTASGESIGQAIGQIGFTGDTYDVNSNTGWTKGKFQLDSYIGNPRVRVRFMFGSNGNDPARYDSTGTVYLGYDGFALDNIHIENRNRIMLAEDFTNTVSSNADVNLTNFIDFKDVQTPTEVVKIVYHTTFGNSASATDPFNALNPSDPAARAAFYGVTTPFKGLLDGYTKGAIDTLKTHWADQYFDSRSLVTSPIDLTLRAYKPNAIDTFGFRIYSKIHSTQDLDTTGVYKAIVAIVEKVSDGSINDGSYVLRKLLPNPAGIPLTIKLKNSDQVLDTLSWTVANNSGINPDSLYAILFVQDIQNKFEVLQSSSFVKIPAPPLITGIEIKEKSIHVYPNPADQELTIELPTATKESMSIRMANQLGQFTEMGSFGEGEKRKTISTSDLLAGVYILQLGSSSNAIRTKVIILHGSK
jgi:hypothetical protein